LVWESRNAPTPAALYQASEPAEAPRLTRESELVPTPQPGSWLNGAAPGLSVLTRPSLDRRMAPQAEAATEAFGWEGRRDERPAGVEWHFTTEDARVKLKRLDPKVEK
jgi:hypothetical protein